MLIITSCCPLSKYFIFKMKNDFNDLQALGMLLRFLKPETISPGVVFRLTLKENVNTNGGHICFKKHVISRAFLGFHGKGWNLLKEKISHLDSWFHCIMI